MRIAKDSPLYNLPIELNSRQKLLLEGIRYTINMAYISWGQLIDSFIKTSVSTYDSSHNYSAFFYAWSLIDNLDRLQGLAKGFGNLRFMNAFSDAKDLRFLRNTYHHIDDKMGAVAELNYPLLGTLSWFKRRVHGFNEYTRFQILSGVPTGELRLDSRVPEPSSLHDPIGGVVLNAVVQDWVRPNRPVPQPFIANIDLTNLMDKVEAAIIELEDFLRPKFAEISSGTNNHQAEILIALDMNIVSRQQP